MQPSGWRSLFLGLSCLTEWTFRSFKVDLVAVASAGGCLVLCSEAPNFLYLMLVSIAETCDSKVRLSSLGSE